MRQDSFIFPVGDQNLSAIRYSGEGGKNSKVLFLHGGGIGSKNSARYLMDILATVGTDSLAFDHSGWGESTGIRDEASLEIRFKEAVEATHLLDTSDPFTIVGTSMGGYIAIRMLEKFPVKNLVLFCPGIYHRDVFGIKFGAGFTDMIRQHESWKNSDVADVLRNFRGNILIVSGEQDNVIPAGVLDMLREASISAQSFEIIKLPDCGHRIHQWLPDKGYFLDTVTEKIISLIREDY